MVSEGEAWWAYSEAFVHLHVDYLEALRSHPELLHPISIESGLKDGRCTERRCSLWCIICVLWKWTFYKATIIKLILDRR